MDLLQPDIFEKSMARILERCISRSAMLAVIASVMNLAVPGEKSPRGASILIDSRLLLGSVTSLERQ